MQGLCVFLQWQIFVFILYKINLDIDEKMAKHKKEKKEKPKIKKNSRRNIRKIMKNVDLSEMTKMAIKNEKERKKRLKIRGQTVRNCVSQILTIFIA